MATLVVTMHCNQGMQSREVGAGGRWGVEDDSQNISLISPLPPPPFFFLFFVVVVAVVVLL